MSMLCHLMIVYKVIFVSCSLTSSLMDPKVWESMVIGDLFLGKVSKKCNVSFFTTIDD